jgi:pyrimidine-nucleoside phosphorylase
MSKQQTDSDTKSPQQTKTLSQLKSQSFSEVIQKKRDGKILTRAEIKDFIDGTTQGKIPEYQIAAFLMATYFAGMNAEETSDLTLEMANSGMKMDLSDVTGPIVDKHSTGGIGDKVTIILAPLAAACGLKVPSMAGRGLGHTGGTIDKLEAIPGYKAVLTATEFKNALKTVGCSIISQSKEIAPADRILYALRDVTATIESIPLITASILSKKIAEGAHGLVMDIKVGNGAFMKQKKRAQALAKSIRTVGQKSGITVHTTLSNMDQPLGYAIGNSVEVYESIEVLKNAKINPYGLGSLDLKELTITLCAQMLVVGGIVKNLPAGRKLALQKLNDGSAFQKFKEMVQFHEGDLSYIDEPSRLIQAEKTIELRATQKGYVTEFDTTSLGRLLTLIGGGREKASDNIDHTVGFFVHKKIGSIVRPNDVLVTIFGREKTDFTEVETRLRKAIQIRSTKTKAPALIMEN